jgi:hypothetical protein
MKPITKEDIAKVCGRGAKVIGQEMNQLFSREIHAIARRLAEINIENEGPRIKLDPLYFGEASFIQGLYIGLKLAEQAGMTLQLVYTEPKK